MKIHRKTLNWALDALHDGRINKTEFEVLFYCACKVQWETMQVPAYSAAQVCLFYREDANQANRQKYVRALKSLEDATAHRVRDDYRHCMPGNERTFTVFLPWESPWTGAVSLYEGMSQPAVSTDVVMDVATSELSSLTDQKTSEQSSESVSQPISPEVSQQNRDHMSITTHGGGKTAAVREKDSLYPFPQRGIAQAPLGFAKSNSGTAGKEPLTVEQSAKLDNLTRLFVDFVDFLWDFIPNEVAVKLLLRHHTAKEVFFALIEKFPPRTRRHSTTQMAQFFAEGASAKIKGKRLKGTSELMPACLEFDSTNENEFSWAHPKTEFVLFRNLCSRWNPINTMYHEIFPRPVETGTAVTP